MIKLSSFKSFLSKSLWLMPFIFFLSGYFTLDLFLHKSSITTPNVLGCHLSEAISRLSAKNLNSRLLSYKENDLVHEETILSQNPSPESSIRPQQTVFLVVSCKKKHPQTPSCIGKHIETLQSDLAEYPFDYKIQYVPSNHPKGTCIAQIPDKETELSSKLTLYISQKSKTDLVLLPSFKQRSLYEVLSFLKDNALSFSIFHTHEPTSNHTCINCIVIDQKPLAGSFINIKNPPTIQLKVND